MAHHQKSVCAMNIPELCLKLDNYSKTKYAFHDTLFCSYPFQEKIIIRNVLYLRQLQTNRETFYQSIYKIILKYELL